MGQYIIIGIAKKIYARKNKFNSMSNFTNDEILEILSKNINLDLFDVKDEERYLCLELKPKMLSENLISLLDKEYEELECKNEEYFEEDWEKLKSKVKSKNFLKDEDEIRNQYFQILKGDISYLSDNHELILDADIITIYTEGKVILECYNGMFRYFRKKIINSIDNPLKEAMFVSIT